MQLSKLLVFYGYLCSWLLVFTVARGDNNSLITAPTNETVYVGQSVNFYSETHSLCNIRTYINGHICETTTNVQSVSNTVGNITYSNCSIYNTQLSDDGTRIVVHVYCHNKITSFGPVYLQVIGPPHSPLNLTIEQYCDMIVITGPVLSEDTTEVYIEIQRDNDTVFNVSKSGFPVYISAAVFEDHNERYRIIVYNKNPAGLSQPYEKDLLFKTVFDIISSSLQIINHKIIMTITVQVNMSCLLSVPQQFNLSSNCLNNNLYQVINGTTINESGLIDLSVILHPNKVNCTITISSGDHELYIINQNTNEVQDVNIIPEDTSTGYFIIKCTFLPGSQAKGCAIEVVNKAGEYIFDQNINRPSSTSSYAVDNSSTCLTNNGTYMIYVYIWDKYGRVNKSSVVTTKRVRVAISYQEDKNTSMSNNITTGNREPGNSDVIHKTKNGPPIVWIVVGCVLTGLIVILVVVKVIVCIVVIRYRRNRNGRQFNEFKLEYIEPIFDKEEQPQNDNITSYNNQIGSTEGTINDERGEQESKNENNESRIEETILEVSHDNNGLPNSNGDYISPEEDTHDHDNNTLKRRSGKPEDPPARDLSVTGLTDGFVAPLINNTLANVIEVRPEVDTQPHEQNIAVSTNKSEHVTATGDPSSTYPTHNYEAQGLIEIADTKGISGDTQETKITTNTIQPHVIQSSSSQPVQYPTSESATFPTDNSETPLLIETTKENEIISTEPLVGQSITIQPVQSLNSESATFPTDGSEVPLLKPEDDNEDQFIYEHSYNVDEKQATNQTTVMVSSVVRRLSTISEKGEQVLSSDNLPTTLGEAVKPVASDETAYQMVYPPPTSKLLPPEQSTIAVPTTPTIIAQEFFFPTNETK